jgi:hypothetical protein
MTIINRFEAWIDIILKPVLESLRNVKAKVFEIKLNVELSEELKSVLGDVGFVTIMSTSTERSIALRWVGELRA